MIEYSLIVTRVAKDKDIFRGAQQTGVQSRNGTALNKNDPLEGSYLVSGPQIHVPKGEFTESEMRDWLEHLSRSEGKEAGNGMKPFSVTRQNSN